MFFRKAKAAAASSRMKPSSGQAVIVVTFTVTGILSGFLLYQLTRNPFLFALTALLCFAIGFSLAPRMMEEDTQKKKGKQADVYLAFFENFALFTAMENSPVQGLNNAIAALEISDLKDKLETYMDSKDITKELPVHFLDNRDENLLRDEIRRLVRDDENYQPSAILPYREFLKSYRESSPCLMQKPLKIQGVAILFSVIYTLIFLFRLLPS